MADRLFPFLSSLLDVNVARATAIWKRFNADGTVSDRTAEETRDDLSLGSAAAEDVEAFATAAQGDLADSSLQPVAVDYREEYNNGDGTYAIGSVVLYEGLLYVKISNPGNPGYPPYGADWELFEPLIGSPAYDLWVQTSLASAGNALPLAGGVMDANATIFFDNGSAIREAGEQGLEIECSVGYRWQWVAGRMILRMVNSGQIARIIAIDGAAPAVTDDITAGFVPGTRWEVADGTVYLCTDSAEGNAVWTEVPVNHIPFDTTGGTLDSMGQVGWDAAEETLAVVLKNDTTLQVGEETLYHVDNVTGSTIDKGTPVMYAGTTGNSGKLRVRPWDGTLPKAFLGIATSDIPDEGTGYVTHFGKVKGFKTNGDNYGETWASGEIIYAVSGSSSLTNITPTTGGYVTVAVVIAARAHNGTLFVRPTQVPTASEVGAQIATAALTDPQVGNQVGNELVVNFSALAAVSALNPGSLVFAHSRPTAGSFTVKTTTGFARPVLAATGALSTQVGTGVPATSLTIPIASGAAMRAMSVISVASGGSVRSGDITEVNILANQGIHSISTSQLTALSSLVVNSNRIAEFDGSGLNALTTLNLANNQLQSFTRGTGLGALTSLTLSTNQLTTFSGAGLSSLTYLQLSANQLTTFSGDGLSSLTSLNLSFNQLTTFSGAGMPSLVTFTLSNNTSMTSLDPSGLASLQTMSVSGCTSLNSLDLSGVADLVSLRNVMISTWAINAQGCGFSAQAINDIFTALPPATNGAATLVFSGNPGSATADASIATSKGYTVSL